MSACFGTNYEGELDITVEEGCIRVRVPAEFSDMNCLHGLEELLKLSDEYAPTNWIIDLSELKNMSLALASVLLGFREETRRSGCIVRFTGIANALFRPFPQKVEWVRCFGVEGTVHEDACELTLQPF
jgi:anti-anti-sigma regulatory factor